MEISQNCMSKRHNGQETETFLCGQNDKLWVSPKVYWAKLTTGYEQRTFIMKNFKLLRLTKGVPETSQNCTFLFLYFSSCFIHEVKIYRLLSERHKGQGTETFLWGQKDKLWVSTKELQKYKKCNERISIRVRNLVIYLWTIW